MDPVPGKVAWSFNTEDDHTAATADPGGHNEGQARENRQAEDKQQANISSKFATLYSYVL